MVKPDTAWLQDMGISTEKAQMAADAAHVQPLEFHTGPVVPKRTTIVKPPASDEKSGVPLKGSKAGVRTTMGADDEDGEEWVKVLNKI